jgi:hypothetical protein
MSVKEASLLVRHLTSPGFSISWRGLGFAQGALYDRCMRAAINFLLVLAVLMCGLHISPAEADESAGRSHGVPAYAQADGERGDDHAQPHATHGCHSHCPVAPATDLGSASNTLTIEQGMHYAAPVDPLMPIAQAPPLEPPSA